MKIQDLVFIILMAILILKKNPTLSSLFGILFLVLSMPLFSFWIFFTAERLTWYAGAFFTLSVIFLILRRQSIKG